MNREYYEQYRQVELNHWWFQGREVVLKSLVRRWLSARTDSSPIRILNVGCATGRSSEWLAEIGHVESVEYDAGCAEMARQFTGMAIQQGSAESLIYSDGSFDLVTAFDVLEHIQKDTVAAAELMRVCAPDGLVLVTVPAFQWLWSDHDLVNQHWRRYRRKELEALFVQASRDGAVAYSGYFNFWLCPVVMAVRLTQRLLKTLGLWSDKKPLISDFQRDNQNPMALVLRQLLSSEGRFVGSGRWWFPFGTSAYVGWLCANALKGSAVKNNS